MNHVTILTLIFVAGAFIGLKFMISTGWLRYVLYIGVGLIWYIISYAWWAQKFFRIK